MSTPKKIRMPRAKELSEELRKKVVEAHKAGKGYKVISKDLGLSKNTIRAVVHKWKRFGTVMSLPRSGRPPKICPTARQEIVQEVMKNPSMSSKDLQAVLTSANIRVHHSTIRRMLRVHKRPALSGLDIMALRTSLQKEAGIEETSEKVSDSSDGFSQGVKVKEEKQDVDTHDSVTNCSGSTMDNTETNCQDDGNDGNKSTEYQGVSDCDSSDDIYKYDDDDDDDDDSCDEEDKIDKSTEEDTAVY